MKSRTYNETLALANEAVLYARTQIIYIPTEPQTTREESIFKVKKLAKVRDRTLTEEESLIELYSIPNKFRFRAWKREIKGAKMHSAGNCGELSNLALNFLRKNNVNAESFKIVNGDHAFVVINRKPNSDPNNPADWGDEAIICDPLLGCCYSAKEIFSKLKCHRLDLKLEQPNVYYDYTNEKLAAVFSVPAIANEDYQKGLISEAKDKIIIIRKALTHFDADQSSATFKKLMQLQHEIESYLDKNKPHTNNDVERAMNRIVKQALVAVHKLPNIDKSKLRKQLIEDLIESNEQLPQPQKDELKKTILLDLCGKQPTDVKKYFKKNK